MLAELLQPSSPIIVKIVEPKEQGLYEVLYGALGVAGVITLASVLLAILLGGLLFWLRSRE